MIDLHSHILPAIDDGATSLAMSLAMARIAVADGIRTMACTPHIYPGVYENDAPGILSARDRLQEALDQEGIDLRLTTGADTHLAPDLLRRLRAGTIPTLHGTRYLLLEPPHHVAPPNLAEHVFNLVAAGYVPIVTHPERLLWIEDHFDLFVQLVGQGAWMQLTAGSVTGLFGPRPKYWAERFLGEGLTHILATDAHSDRRRTPVMSEGREAAARLVGAGEAERLVQGRPGAVLLDTPPDQVAPLPERRPARGGWRRLFQRPH